MKIHLKLCLAILSLLPLSVFASTWPPLPDQAWFTMLNNMNVQIPIQLQPGSGMSLSNDPANLAANSKTSIKVIDSEVSNLEINIGNTGGPGDCDAILEPSAFGPGTLTLTQAGNGAEGFMCSLAPNNTLIVDPLSH